MKHVVLSLLASAALVSCASGPNAQTGTVVGGLSGAALGGIIGHQSGRGLEGAAIGGGLGALAGNLIGDSQDQRRGYATDRYGRRYYTDRYGRPVYVDQRAYAQPRYQRTSYYRY